MKKILDPCKDFSNLPFTKGYTKNAVFHQVMGSAHGVIYEDKGSLIKRYNIVTAFDNNKKVNFNK